MARDAEEREGLLRDIIGIFQTLRETYRVPRRYCSLIFIQESHLAHYGYRYSFLFFLCFLSLSLICMYVYK
jgi:hypothetical protein